MLKILRNFKLVILFEKKIFLSFWTLISRIKEYEKKPEQIRAKTCRKVSNIGSLMVADVLACSHIIACSIKRQTVCLVRIKLN